MRWFVEPDVKRLPLEGGEWVDVKVRLTHGEREKMIKASMGDTGADMRTLIVLTYLVAWSITRNGKPIDMSPDVPADRRVAVLRSLSVEAFDAVHAAIDAHYVAVRAEDEAAKNVQDGGTESSVILPSPDSATGDTRMS